MELVPYKSERCLCGRCCFSSALRCVRVDVYKIHTHIRMICYVLLCAYVCLHACVSAGMVRRLLTNKHNNSHNNITYRELLFQLRLNKVYMLTITKRFFENYITVFIVS